MKILVQTVVSAWTVTNIKKYELIKTITNKDANEICYGKWKFLQKQ